MGHWETVTYPNGDEGVRYVYDTPEEEAKAAADRKIDAATAIADLEDEEKGERR